MQGYFDHNATSPLHAQVLTAMMPYLKAPVANASSLHRHGRIARSAIEQARQQLADLVNVPTDSVIFTSSGSEANNLWLKGLLDEDDQRPIVSTPIEHPSILEPLKQLQQLGQDVIYLPVDRNGVVNIQQAYQLLVKYRPKMLSVMLANNETGVLQPVEQLAQMVAEQDCLVHTDATQVVGKLPVDMAQLGVDALTLSAHKLQGPQGIGALISRQNPRQILISGGAQEKYRRAGTENVANIVGFGKAAEIAKLEMAQQYDRLVQLTAVFESRLMTIPGVVIFGQSVTRLPNTTYFSIPYYHGETLLMELDKAGFSVASGSACHSTVTQASSVLVAMGVDDTVALNAVRVSLGTSNSLEEINALANCLEMLVKKLPTVIRQSAG